MPEAPMVRAARDSEQGVGKTQQPRVPLFRPGTSKTVQQAGLRGRVQDWPWSGTEKNAALEAACTRPVAERT